MSSQLANNSASNSASAAAAAVDSSCFSFLPARVHSTPPLAVRIAKPNAAVLTLKSIPPPVNIADSSAAAIVDSASSSAVPPTCYFCYLLESQNSRYSGHNYIGFTNNPIRRLRQHNGLISSGAAKTARKRPWVMIACVYGFPSSVAALQFEWCWTFPRESKKLREFMKNRRIPNGNLGKFHVLFGLLNCPPFDKYPLHIKFLTDDHCQQFYHKLANREEKFPFPKHIDVTAGSLLELEIYKFKVNRNLNRKREKINPNNVAEENLLRKLSYYSTPNGNEIAQMLNQNSENPSAVGDVSSSGLTSDFDDCWVDSQLDSLTSLTENFGDYEFDEEAELKWTKTKFNSIVEGGKLELLEVIDVEENEKFIGAGRAKNKPVETIEDESEEEIDLTQIKRVEAKLSNKPVNIEFAKSVAVESQSNSSTSAARLLSVQRDFYCHLCRNTRPLDSFSSQFFSGCQACDLDAHLICIADSIQLQLLRKSDPNTPEFQSVDYSSLPTILRNCNLIPPAAGGSCPNCLAAWSFPVLMDRARLQFQRRNELQFGASNDPNAFYKNLKNSVQQLIHIGKEKSTNNNHNNHNNNIHNGQQINSSSSIVHNNLNNNQKNSSNIDNHINANPSSSFSSAPIIIENFSIPMSMNKKKNESEIINMENSKRTENKLIELLEAEEIEETVEKYYSTHHRDGLIMNNQQLSNSDILIVDEEEFISSIQMKTAAAKATATANKQIKRKSEIEKENKGITNNSNQNSKKSKKPTAAAATTMNAISPSRIQFSTDLFTRTDRFKAMEKMKFGRKSSIPKDQQQQSRIDSDSDGEPLHSALADRIRHRMQKKQNGNNTNDGNEIFNGNEELIDEIPV